MNSYDVFLFDLDGTLTDSGPGITKSVSYAIKKLNRPVPERSQLNQFIGPPLLDSFMNFCDFNEEEATQAIAYYREYYLESGIFENIIYDGIPTVLQQLSAAGKILILATSKPEAFAKQILEHTNIAQYFTYIAGANLDGSRTKKHEVIEYALANSPIKNKSKTIIIGDRNYDVLGAKQIGIDSMGVLYGYGSEEELIEAGATYIATTVADITKLLL